MRRRVAVLAALLIASLLAGAAAWWAWPEAWRAPEPAPTVKVEDRRPAWARRARPPRLALPPISLDRSAEVETPEVSAEVPAAGPAVLAGWVVDERGRDVAAARVIVRCETARGQPRGGWTVADEHGWFELEIDAPAVCALHGFREDGAFRALSQEEVLDLRPGDDVEVDLIVPGERVGGIGAQVAPHPDGVLLERVLPGSPAARASLVAGDVVVAVEGASVVGASLDDFLRQMTGPAGTEVVFLVLPGGDPDAKPVEVSARRAALDAL